MAKLIDKTPKDLFGEGYQRIEPIYLDSIAEKGYEIIGVDLANRKPCIYIHGNSSHGPEVFLAELNKRFYAGTLSAGSFYPDEDLRGELLAKKKRLPIALLTIKEFPVTYVEKRTGLLKRESFKLPNILITPVFNSSFKKDYGELKLEKALYTHEKKILVDGKEVEIGFEEWEMRMDYFLNHFMSENQKENLEALIENNTLCQLDNKDTILFNPGFKLQFRE
ncbi:hypothetical protein HYV49_02950 [Candidatus Pacearchaeota archaeon]|nr:hypothetical protein [Candidatus Pacearchaeota archaeon]